jgi:hypothetical protein
MHWKLWRMLVNCLDLAKGLVCIQVLWVAGQAIERKVAGFPISLLEFHTLVHVFCALVMYALWIRKPYDIQEPTIVSTDSFPHILAFIVSSSRWPRNNGLQKVFKPLHSSADILKLVLFWIEELLFSRPMDPQFMYYGNLRNTPQAWVTTIPTGTPPLRTDDSRIQNHLLRVRGGPDPSINNKLAEIIAPPPETPYFPAEEVGKSYKPGDGAKEVLTLVSGQALKSGLGPRTSWDPLQVPGRVAKSEKGVRIALSQKDFDRLNLAADFIRVLLDASKAKSPPSLFPPQFSKENNKDLEITQFCPFAKGIIRPYDDNLICVRQNNWFHWELFHLFNTFGKYGNLYSFTIIALAIVIIPAAYGGIHLGAIHNIFPSEIELTLWRSSCYILLGFAGLLVVSIQGILVLLYMSTACEKAIDRWLEKKWVEIIWIICVFIIFGAGCVLGFVITLLYIAARLFIVVESFISLRHMPIGVYQTPDTNFMSYIPHL